MCKKCDWETYGKKLNELEKDPLALKNHLEWIFKLHTYVWREKHISPKQKKVVDNIARQLADMRRDIEEHRMVMKHGAPLNEPADAVTIPCKCERAKNGNYTPMNYHPSIPGIEISVPGLHEYFIDQLESGVELPVYERAKSLIGLPVYKGNGHKISDIYIICVLELLVKLADERKWNKVIILSQLDGLCNAVLDDRFVLVYVNEREIYRQWRTRYSHIAHRDLGTRIKKLTFDERR